MTFQALVRRGFTFFACLLNARVSQSSVFRILFLTLYFLGAKYYIWGSVLYLGEPLARA